jgi:streptogramin lyase
MGITHLRNFARVAGALAIAAAIGAASPALGAVPSANCQSSSMPANTCLGDPLAPDAIIGRLGSPASPEEDLSAALADLKAAPDAATAARARGRALAIIVGSAGPLVGTDKTFLDHKAYAGIPLLNTAAKPKVVPAPTEADPVPTVDVREVRFGDHAILDTSMLQFEDMDAPFTINWHVTELGTTFGGVLAPAAAKAGGAQAAVWEPLGLPGLSMGTAVKNRFHPAGDIEETRLATQVFPVRMDAPSTLGGSILDPNLKPGAQTFAQIAIGAAATDAGQPATPEPTLPTAAQVSEWSAVGQIYRDLSGLDPDNIDLDAAHTVGAQDGPVVPAMASRDTLPKPAAASPTADVNVQFANAEAYLDKRELRVAPGGSLTFSITNLDGIARHFDVRQLHNRPNIGAQGVLSWGTFDSDVLGDGIDVAAGATETLTVTPAGDAFSLWVGDPNGGSQAAMAIALDRGPVKQSLELGLGPVKPLHEALDAAGNLWVTLANTDEVARLTPTSGSLSAPDPEVFPLPGGINDKANPPDPATALAGPVLGPGDVQVDGHGIVWVTLGVGNAIARIDPSKAKKGTTDGITVIPLQACTDVTCRRAPVPGAAATLLSRIPLQLRVYEDGGENTAIFFTEQASDAIGVLRVSPTGAKLNEAHIKCGCLQPLGLALDPGGDIWFTEGSSNRLGRMTLNPAAPFAATGHTIEHYDIPNAVCEAVPGQVPNGDPACANPTGPLPPLTLPNPALTTLPHSVAVDRKGRVWYTGEASERVGYLDPTKAENKTKKGFTDAPGPVNEFGRSLAPADLTVDADGTVFFSDEYGDQVASATVDGTGQIQTKFAFRPNARNSLTDSPLVDPQGNLWFLEAGANLITRISGVAAGVPLPSRSPLLVANTATGRVTGSGLSTEISSLDVRVVRGSTVVAHADGVPVQGRSFDTTVPLRADDRVEFVPHGPHPPATFSFRVASLVAGASAGGRVAGSALTGSSPLADSVTIEAAGRTVTAKISADDGSFSWAGPATGGTVSWTAGSVSARFRTVTPFGLAPTASIPVTGGATTPQPNPTPATAAPQQSATPQPPACTTARWLTRTGSGAKARRVLPLLDLSTADAQRCLGTPSARRRSGATERWTYRGAVALELQLTNGRVSAFTLRGRGLRSAPDRAAVGSSLHSFRKALGRLARDGKRGYRAAVAIGSDRVGDVRLTVSASGRVTRVSATLKARAALDAAGRRLLGGAR